MDHTLISDLIFSKFLYLFNRREKLQILALFFLILIGALLETFVVGLIYPFISILKSPEIIQDHKVLRWIYCAMWIKSTKQFVMPPLNHRQKLQRKKEHQEVR